MVYLHNHTHTIIYSLVSYWADKKRYEYFAA